MATKELSQFNILIVDDAPVILELMKGIFIELGYSGVITATNGHEALQELTAKEFDLILCDWDMPSMNGLELLRVLRDQEKKNNEGKCIPFLMVTGKNDIKKVTEAIKLKVTDYIVKPFKPDEIKERLVKYFH